MFRRWLTYIFAAVFGGLGLPDIGVDTDSTPDTDDVIESRIGHTSARPHVTSAVTPRPVRVDVAATGDVTGTAESVWIGRLDDRAVAQARLRHVQPFAAHLSVRHTATTWPPHTLYEQLVRAAAQQTWQSGDLKLTIDTPLDSDALRQFVEPEGFLYWRSRQIADRRIVEFYTNLYVVPHHESERRYV